MTTTSDISTPYTAALALAVKENDARQANFLRGCQFGFIRARSKAAALVEALLVALRAPTCPCCGRDNPDLGNGSECTSDDCPGVQALTAHEKGA